MIGIAVKTLVAARDCVALKNICMKGYLVTLDAAETGSPRVKQIVTLMMKTSETLSTTEPMMARGRVADASRVSSDMWTEQS